MWHVLNLWRLEGPRKFSFLLLLCLFAFIFYFIYINDSVYTNMYYTTSSSHKNSSDNQTWINLSKYQVYNKKCHMLSLNPYDPSIRPFVKDEKFEACSSEPRLSSISRKSNGNIYLVIDENAAKHYKSLSCCWAPISRPKGEEIDSNISVGTCQNFKQNVLLNKSIEVVFVNCTAKTETKNKMKTVSKVIHVYENVHAVINPERINHQKLNASTSALSKNNTKATHQRQLSVLMLGLDSVSSLNFYRTMPLTRTYFEKRGWAELRAYNKMGDNTLPNLMAILTGQNETTVKKCHENMPHAMDNCSMIWSNFRDAGYATAYAEDQSWISTFNYAVGGFVEPPTDYYLRPYVLASEKLLKVRTRFSAKYCTGPELSVDRIFDVAMDFSKTFINSPYFGFFWTNAISHDYMNAPSVYDSHFLDKLQSLENHGVMNDTMVIVLSDHGMRYGDSRDTFVGWYEERLPFVYMWLPQWFREQNPHSYEALLVNQDRLTSPYDMHETLRDILQRAGGQAPASSGCSSCSSLFKPVPFERGCKDAGISPHWCTCADFEPFDGADPIATEGVERFVDYMNSVIENYKNENGTMLCSKLALKRIIRVKKLIDLDEDSNGKTLKLFYLLEVTPGGGKFETTVSYHGPGRYTIEGEEVSRINLYGHSAKCLEKGLKKYCECETLEMP